MSAIHYVCIDVSGAAVAVLCMLQFGLELRYPTKQGGDICCCQADLRYGVRGGLSRLVVYTLVRTSTSMKRLMGSTDMRGADEMCFFLNKTPRCEATLLYSLLGIESQLQINCADAMPSFLDVARGSRPRAARHAP